MDLVDLVRGPETVEKVDEGHAGLERRRMRHQGQVMRLLHTGRGQQGEAGGPRGHHVLMVAENRQTLRGQGTRRDVENRRRKFAGDLVHVGQHQHQAL